QYFTAGAISLESYGTASPTRLPQQDRKKVTSMKTACTSRIAFLKPRGVIGFALYAVASFWPWLPSAARSREIMSARSWSASVPAQATGGMWTATDDLGIPRADHTATLLLDGQVLVTGGARVVFERDLES